MRILNRGTRAFIIKKTDAVHGCRFPKDELGSDKAYIDPDTEVEVVDSCGEDILKLYPKELREIKSHSPSENKSALKKVKKAKSKKRG